MDVRSLRQCAALCAGLLSPAGKPCQAGVFRPAGIGGAVPTIRLACLLSCPLPGSLPMLTLNRIHHAAIIASDVAVSKRFYTECLGLTVVGEHFRAERNSWKLDLALPDGSQIELFTFPGSPPRPSWPEAQGLRHLAFEVDDVAACKQKLEALGVAVQPVRVDEFTGRRFVFFDDPDGLPLELYEAA